MAIKDAGPLSDFDRLTCTRRSTIVALELLRSGSRGDTERRLAGDVLAASSAGELDRRRAARRLEPFGLAERVARSPSSADDRGRPPAAPRRRSPAALRDEATPALVATTGALICALVPGMGEEELFALAERVAARSAELGRPVALGVGRAVAGERRAPQLPRGAVRARGVLALGARGGTPTAR